MRLRSSTLVLENTPAFAFKAGYQYLPLELSFVMIPRRQAPNTCLQHSIARTCVHAHTYGQAQNHTHPNLGLNSRYWTADVMRCSACFIYQITNSLQLVLRSLSAVCLGGHKIKSFINETISGTCAALSPRCPLVADVEPALVITLNQQNPV